MIEKMTDWEPNAGRVFKVNKYGYNAPVLGRWNQTKPLNVTLDYSVDFINLLKEGDYIDGFSVDYDKRNFFLPCMTIYSSKVVIFIKGGVSNSAFSFGFSVHTKQGDFFTKSLLLSISGNAPDKAENIPFPPPNTIHFNNLHLVNHDGNFLMVG